jgi:hypothetical protein
MRLSVVALLRVEGITDDYGIWWALYCAADDLHRENPLY